VDLLIDRRHPAVWDYRWATLSRRACEPPGSRGRRGIPRIEDHESKIGITAP
jgi:hypothetical protein